MEKNLAESYATLTYDELIKITLEDVQKLRDDELLQLRSMLEKDTRLLTAQLDEANAPLRNPENKLRGFGHIRIVAGSERKVRNRILYDTINEISKRTEGSECYWQHYADSVCQAMTGILSSEQKEAVLMAAKELRAAPRRQRPAPAPSQAAKRTNAGPY